MRVGIVGGGIMGLSLGYFLTRQGIEVEVFEASPGLGGLASSMLLEDGTKVDRFYHALLASDNHVIGMCRDLGIEDQLRFRETQMGFYDGGALHSMNGMVDFLRFPPLDWSDRFRLGLTVLYAQLVRDWHKLEGVSVKDWLVGLSGRRTYKKIWRPLLRAKFDGDFDNTPATYIWSRLVRIKSARGGAEQKEKAGHLVGSYSTMIRALAKQIETQGGQVHTSHPVNNIRIDADRGVVRGLHSEGREVVCDAVVGTVPVPDFQRLIPDAPKEYHNHLSNTEYLGVVCLLMVLDRPLTGFWTLNITDDTIPFTGVIETTSYIEPLYVGGHHLVYLPKYVAPGSQWAEKSDEEIEAFWMQHLKQMFHGFDQNWIRYSVVQRARYVEPIHPLNSCHFIPSIETPIENLYLATSAQIYPRLTNIESVTRHASEVAQGILKQTQMVN